MGFSWSMLLLQRSDVVTEVRSRILFFMWSFVFSSGAIVVTFGPHYSMYRYNTSVLLYNIILSLAPSAVVPNTTERR